MMRLLARCTTLLAASLAVAAPAPAASVYELAIKPLRQDVYLIYRPDPLRQPVEGNVVAIVNAQDVVVVDGGGAPLAAHNAIRLIRSVTDKPVSVLINTHWHGDHNLGNQVYRATFPGLAIVSHETTYRHMTGDAMSYVAELPTELDGYLREFEEMARKEPLDERRARLYEDLKAARREAEHTRLTPPDMTFSDTLILRRGSREIRVLHLGKANTDGDALVWLPEEKILITGDVLVHPLPYGIGSYPREWIATLDKVKALPFDMLAPGHGEVQRDRRYIELVQRTLAEIRKQTAAAVSAGMDLEATTAAIDASSFEQEFTQGDKVRATLFRAWWLGPITRSAWLEAKGEPIVQSGKSDNR